MPSGAKTTSVTTDTQLCVPSDLSQANRSTQWGTKFLAVLKNKHHYQAHMWSYPWGIQSIVISLAIALSGSGIACEDKGCIQD